MTPRISSSRRMRCSIPSIFTSVPEYLPNSTRSPFLTSTVRVLPLSRTLPVPTATTSPSIGFSLAESGMMIPLLVFSAGYFPCATAAHMTTMGVNSRATGVMLTPLKQWVNWTKRCLASYHDRMQLHRSVSEYFHDAVTEALRVQEVHAGQAAEFYL